MKILKSVAIFVSLTFLAVNPSFADSNFARIIQVQPYYQQVYTTEYQTVCENIHVPVYGTRNGSSGEVIGGAIVGGLIGREISGNDRGAIIGAIIGGASMNQRSVQNGYRIERHCNQVLVERPMTAISYYIVTYEWNGYSYRTETQNTYNVGDLVPIDPNPRF